jgi:lipoprotein-releasing system permease protein|tara:strand:+ start:2076 stop:3293 length:1218 start_codon:yes stop_codon:yes gene_type:complete
MNVSKKIYASIWKSNLNVFSSVIKKIALATIAIGLSSIILSVFILEGFKKEIKKKIYNFSGHYNVSSYADGISFQSSPLDLNKGLFSNYYKSDKIRNIYPYILNSALAQGNHESIEGVVFKGIDINFYDEIIDNIVVYDQSFDLNKNFSKSILISSKISKKLKSSVGDTLTIFYPNTPPIFRKLIVYGIYETGLEEIDDVIVYGDININRKINGWDKSKASGISIFINDSKNIDTFYSEIKSFSGYDEFVETTNQKYIQLFDWLNLLDKNVIIFFVIISFVASFNILSIIIILVMERIKMIGILKSFGAKTKFITSIFVRVGIRLLITGVCLGNVFAFFIIYIQNKFQFFKLNKESYYIENIPFDINYLMLIKINFLVTFIILISIAIPLFIINRIRIINSIQFS